MSQDLFAAFGEAPSEPKASNPVANVDDEDDFGDFEDASDPSGPPVEPTTEAGQSNIGKAPATIPKPAPRDTRPFPPKATSKPEPPKTEPKPTDEGSHPFAGRWDLLFEAGDDEYDAGTDELADLSTNPEAAMAYSKRIIAEQEAAQTKKESIKSEPPKSISSKSVSKKFAPSHSRNASNSDSGPKNSGPKKLRKKSGYVPAHEPEVLFDAENVSDQDNSFDDFRDFETEGNGSTSTVTPIARVERPQAMPAIDLLGLDDLPSVTQEANGYVNASQAPWNLSSAPSKAAVAAQTEDFGDDAWDDFETAAPPSSPPRSNIPENSRTSSHAQSPAENTSKLAPTNIPPPVVLLSLFPPLFRSAEEALFNTMTKLDLKQRQILLAHPASHQFLRGYLSHAIVLARIIAGRKLRWKRDQRLSQSMRIGPSAAGGKSGMKLTGVDKSEVAKEDREVLDTLDLWKAQVGKLRTAVTTASSAPGLSKLPSVPEITENMPVRTLKASESGMSAPHACAVCGLRRDERVAKVDLEVEDSFGEWWVEGMNMHLACRTFWDEFKKKLKSR